MEKKKYIAIATFDGFGKTLNRILFTEAFKNQFYYEYTTEEARTNAVNKMIMRAKKKGSSVTFKLVTKIERIDEVDSSTL